MPGSAGPERHEPWYPSVSVARTPRRQVLITYAIDPEIRAWSLVCCAAMGQRQEQGGTDAFRSASRQDPSVALRGRPGGRKDLRAHVRPRRDRQLARGGRGGEGGQAAQERQAETRRGR